MSEKNYCPLNYTTMSLIGTKWKPLILFHFGWRFTFRLLQKKISGISNKMFTQTVRELEKDGLISRKIFL
jgi:DNA-binding HxlR family transcriptional regulator